MPKKFDMSRLAVVGSSQGGLTALAAAAFDDRFRAAVVGDYFGDRSRASEEPADRAVFRHLVEFDDADLASLVAPRPLCVVTKTRDKAMPPAAAGQTAFEAIKTVYVKLNASGALSLMLAGDPKAFPADIGPSATRFLCEQFGLNRRPLLYQPRNWMSVRPTTPPGTATNYLTNSPGTSTRRIEASANMRPNDGPIGAARPRNGRSSS